MIVSIMAHILAKIEGVKVTDIKDQLVSDMTKHAEFGRIRMIRMRSFLSLGQVI